MRLMKFKLPVTAPTTLYLDVDRIISIRDAGLQSRDGQICSAIEYETSIEPGNWNVVGTPTAIFKYISEGK